MNHEIKDTDVVIIVDLGTSSIKSLVISSEGVILAKVRTPWPLMRDSEFGGIVEVNKKEARNKIFRTIKQSIISSKIHSSQVKAISCISLRAGTVFLDKKGQELYVGPNYDARGVFTDFAFSITEEQQKKIYQASGHVPPFMFSPLRYWWFKENKHSVIDRLNTILSFHDWGIYVLTGQLTAEPTTASTHMLLDLNKRQWNDEILDFFGMNDDYLPEIKETGDFAGYLTEEAAKILNIPSIPIYLGGGDSHFGLVACRALEEGDVGFVAGYTAPTMQVTSSPTIDEQQRTWTSCHVFANYWVVESNMGPCGQLIEWFSNHFLAPILDNLPSPITEKHELLFNFFENIASKSPIGSNRTFFKPTTMIMNAAKMIDTPTRSLFTFNSPINPFGTIPSANDFANAITEAIAFALKANMEQLENITSLDPKTVGITGGMTKFTHFLETLVNVLDRPLRVTQHPDGSSLGRAALLFKQLNLFGSIEESLDHVVPMKTIEPNIEAVNVMKEYYDEWKEFHDQSITWEM